MLKAMLKRIVKRWFKFTFEDPKFPETRRSMSEWLVLENFLIFNQYVHGNKNPKRTGVSAS
jgi:hypothetical protein